MRRGLRAGGWQCVYANDIEAKKRQMYEAEFGPCSYYHVEDVWKTAAVLDHLRDRPFLATASFPCVDLSVAGHWRGFQGEQSRAYFGFLEVLSELEGRMPGIVMLENVSGLLTSRNGADFARAIGELARLGYWIDAMVLDAKWFVPQSRPRTFIFGFHETLHSPLLIRRPERFVLENPWAFAIAQSGPLRPTSLLELTDRIELPTGWATVAVSPPPQQALRLTDVIDLHDDLEWWDEIATQKHYEMMEPPSRRRVDDLMDQKATSVGTAFRRTRRGKTRTEVRFDMAGCLRTPKGGSAKQIVVAVVRGRLRMRWMTPREYARLQGAGDFAISVPPIQAMYGFGDAVCVPAVEWIDRNILTPVFESAVSLEVPRSSAAAGEFTTLPENR